VSKLLFNFDYHKFLFLSLLNCFVDLWNLSPSMAVFMASCLHGREYVPLNRFLFSSRNPLGFSGYPNCLGRQQGELNHVGSFLLQCSSIDPLKKKQTISNSDDVNINKSCTKQAAVDNSYGTSVSEDPTLELENTKPVETYAELPTKHEPTLKPSVEERAKTSLPPISISEKLEQFLDGLRKLVAPRRKGDILDVMLMSISFAVYVYISQKIVCAYCMWQSMQH